MVSIEKWLPLVFLGIPTVPDPVARQYISLVANDFANKTFACQRVIRLDVEEGVEDYYFEDQLSESEELLALLDHTYGRYPRVTNDSPTCSGCTLWCGGLSLTYDPKDYSVRFPSPPSESYPGGLRLTIAVSPTPDAQEVDDILWTIHSQAILHGVQEKLYALPNYPWSSLAYSRAQGAAYAAKVNAGKLMSIMDRTATPVRMRRKGAL